MLTEFRQKVEVFSDMSFSLNQSQMAKDEVTGLIKDVRSFVEHIIIEEQKTKQNSLVEQGLRDLPPAPPGSVVQRRKSRSSQKRKASKNMAPPGPSRMGRFRKKAKLNYSEGTDLDDEESLQ